MGKRRWTGAAIWFSRDDLIRGLQELFFVPAWALEKAMTQNYHRHKVPRKACFLTLEGWEETSLFPILAPLQANTTKEGPPSPAGSAETVV